MLLYGFCQNDSGYPSHLYTFTVTPPSGSNLFSTTLSNTSITVDTNLTMTMQQPVIISGHIYDPSGSALPNQTVGLLKYSDGSEVDVNTDNSGAYSFQQITTGTRYRFIVRGGNGNDSAVHVPQSYSMFGDYTPTQNATIDVTVPAKKVTLHVQDALNNSLSNIAISANPASGTSGPVNYSLPIGGGIVGTATTSYGNGSPMTDASGNAVLWLLPNNDSNNFSNHLYVLTATPPNGSIYSSFALNNISVTSDENELISLQYSHNPPTTTATLSPSPDNQGNYSDPTTVTLSATPTSGYTIANTYYTIDGGSQQTYSSPFTVTGNGSHTITYWSVDNSGVIETHNTKTFTILARHSLTGTVYVDTNQNGFQDTGETGYAGATVTLDSGQSTTTDSSGNYSFTNVPAGTYVETLTVPNGYTATTTNPANISLAADTTENFGIAQQNANTLVTAINAGGSDSGNFVADTNFSDGSQYSSSATVDTSGVSNPAPQAVYQTVRYGNTFSYTIPNLTADGIYTVRLHFNELYWGTTLSGNSGGEGSRVFNVAINGTQVLSNYDIYATAGGANKAVTEQLPATADSNGNIIINFTTVTDNAMVNGIEVYTGTLPLPSPTATPTPASTVLINIGGSAVGNFVADADYSGGTTYSSTASVDTSSVTNPAPEAVYQTVRYGNFTYNIPHLVPSHNYLVRLHFNELYWTSAGNRVFNVSINGTQVLNNFDIFQAAGGENKAIVEEFTEQSNSQGKMSMQFSTVTDNAMVNGIELIEQ